MADLREQVEKAFRASATQIITDTTFQTNWEIVSCMFLFSEEASGTYRLYQSQTFQDSDYPTRVLNFFEAAARRDSARTNSMIVYVLEDLKKKGLITQAQIDSLPAVKAYMENKDLEEFSKIITASTKVKFLDLKGLPDDFYVDLVDDLNKAFAYGLYDAVNLFARKLLENLLIDVLRKRFHTRNIALYFDTTHGIARNFNTLVKNFSDNLADFKTVVSTLDATYVSALNKFRETGNAAAHSLETHITEADLQSKKQDLEFAVKLLVRLFNNVVPI